MRGPNALEALLGTRGFFAVRRNLDDALPRLGGTFEILLPPGAHDADIQQRLRVLRVECEGPLELFERPVGLVRVVIRDPEIGADVDVLRIDLEGGEIPPGGFIEPLTVKVDVSELRADLGIPRFTFGLRFELRDAVLIQCGCGTLPLSTRRRSLGTLNGGRRSAGGRRRLLRAD